MKHHHNEEEKDYNYIYYLVGLISGLFTGAIIDVSFAWIAIGGVLGLLTAAFYANVLAKSSEA